MAKKYAFTRERDVRRALKTSRLVLDRRVMQPAQFSRAPSFTAGSSTTTGAANCPCGTQYKRGSQTLTLNSVDYEHATTYTVTATCFDGTWWFPEVTYDTGTWLSGVEEILACYAGGIDAELQIEPFYVTIDGVDVLHAWAILTTDANDCTDIDSVAGEDVEARWLCRNWNPLGPTAQFELMGPTKLGDVDLPKFLCVVPKQPLLSCGGWTVPESVRLVVNYTTTAPPCISAGTVTYDEVAETIGGAADGACCLYDPPGGLLTPEVAIQKAGSTVEISWRLQDGGGGTIYSAKTEIPYTVDWAWDGSYELTDATASGDCYGTASDCTVPATIVVEV